MKLFTLLLIFLVFPFASMSACDCIPVWTFLKTTCSECDVFLARVIEDRSLIKEDLHPSHEYTTVVVLNHIYGNAKIDTVRILEGIGDLCLGRLAKRNYGDTILISGKVFEDFLVEDDKIIELETIEIRSCCVQSLIYSKGYVYGNITHNNQIIKNQQLNKFLNLVPSIFLDEDKKQNILNKQKNEGNSIQQKMKIEKLAKLLVKEYDLKNKKK